ncbi:ribonuclease III [Sphingomonas sp.]|uniref:ribonuclease III n=1 Tax=Sphingomonas sp. TaxID=28214 RepID=UPI002D7E4EA5|nr:ribonuclease III [Sphingomonas sp.]HEU0043107.1 ribonuclease III [Sphingomonas sp.]
MTATFGHAPADLALWTRALTHGSREDEGSYERLEFLGDRVLGLSIAEWLYQLFPDEPEGKLTRRLNLLVSGAICAEVAREIGVGAHLRLNKQASDDGVRESDYVLGDAIESLLGALYLEAGLEAAGGWVRQAWESRLNREDAAPKHPKAELQDWALAKNRGLPVYAIVEQSGPGHARQHTVSVRVGEAEQTGTGSTKREAETQAARRLLRQLKATAPIRKAKAISARNPSVPRRASKEIGV